jgi:superfamily I DNA/RNA helicase
MEMIARSKIRNVKTKIESFDHRELMDLCDLTDLEINILINEFSSEGRYDIDKFFYKFKFLTINDLPMSHFEQAYLLSKEVNIERYYPKKRNISLRDYIQQGLNNISNFEEIFKKIGFDYHNHAIILQLTDINNSQFEIFGGNHRVQSIRDLCEKNELSKDYLIHCVFCVPLFYYVTYEPQYLFNCIEKIEEQTPKLMEINRRLQQRIMNLDKKRIK